MSHYPANPAFPIGEPHRVAIPPGMMCCIPNPCRVTSTLSPRGACTILWTPHTPSLGTSPGHAFLRPLGTLFCIAHPRRVTKAPLPMHVCSIIPIPMTPHLKEILSRGRTSAPPTRQHQPPMTIPPRSTLPHTNLAHIYILCLHPQILPHDQPCPHDQPRP